MNTHIHTPDKCSGINASSFYCQQLLAETRHRKIGYSIFGCIINTEVILLPDILLTLANNLNYNINSRIICTFMQSFLHAKFLMMLKNIIICSLCEYFLFYEYQIDLDGLKAF